MGSNGPGNPILQVMLVCIFASVALAALGFWLHRQGKLSARGPALAWAILTIAPLFGAGAIMMGKHTVEMATGDTKSGVNEPPAKSAP